jgi:Zn-dependent protease with chaperone function
MGVSVSIDPVEASRLEAAAAAHPKSYRFRLALLAIAGDVALTLAQVLPLTGIVLIGMFVMNNWFFYAAGTVIVLGVVWLVRPDSRVGGRFLCEDEAPRLREELAALKQKIRMADEMDIRLDGSFNASAMELRGVWGLIGTRRILTIGIPLLLLLSREELLAVVAHEFGHFSRKHGRIGPWLYRARDGWLRYIERTQDSPLALEKVAAIFAEKFVPYFSVRSFVHSRQSEYEADRDAAEIMGAAVCAAALTKTAVLGGVWQDWVHVRVRVLQAEFTEPVENIYQDLSQFILAQAPDEMQARLDAEMAASSHWEDTHPALSERLRAIGQAPSLPMQSGQAGETLFGEQWPAILREFNADWAKSSRMDWVTQHFRLKHLVLPRVSDEVPGPLSGEVSASAQGPELARAKAILFLDEERGVAELTRLHEAHPQDGQICFAYATALMDRGDAAGAAVLEKLALDDAGFWYEAVRRGRDFFLDRGNPQQLEKWSQGFETAMKVFKQPQNEFLARVDAGQVAPSTLPEAEKAFLADVLARDPCIEHAWLIGGQVGVWRPARRPQLSSTAHLLVATLDNKVVNDSGQNASLIAKRYQELLRSVVPPNEISISRLYFKTEKIPEVYQPNGDYSLKSA